MFVLATTAVFSVSCDDTAPNHNVTDTVPDMNLLDTAPDHNVTDSTSDKILPDTSPDQNVPDTPPDQNVTDTANLTMTLTPDHNETIVEVDYEIPILVI